jgi:hypothetical protein
MKRTVFCLFAAFTLGAQAAGAQSPSQHLPTTDAEKIVDANIECSERVVVNGLAYLVHHPAPCMMTRDVSIGFSFSL